MSTVDRPPVSAAEHLKALIDRHGAISFERYMETVLYHPLFGYYRGPFKTRRDYVTAPQVSSLFALLLAGFISRLPEIIAGEGPLMVIELGAGDGRLAREATGSPHLSPLISGGELLWIALDIGFGEEGPRHRGHFQPVAADGLEAIGDCGRAVVLSNEFFDALPCRVIRCLNGRFQELHVAFGEDGPFEVLVDSLPDDLAHYIEESAIPCLEGAQYEISLAAEKLIRRLSGIVKKGLMMTIDYGGSREGQIVRAAGGGTLRTFDSHSVAGRPLDKPGAVDLTADVNFFDLIRWGEALGWRTVYDDFQWKFMLSQGMLEELSRLALDVDGRESLSRYLAAKRFLVPEGLQERYRILLQSKGLDDQTTEEIVRLAAGGQPIP